MNLQLKDFKTISLNHLNAKASFLKRIEQKYLLNSKDFISIIKDLKKDFNILDINGKKVFIYDNVYMDTSDYLFYNQHQNKLNSRIKVRTRFYVDSNLAFFELKHKLN
ncbi:MAG: VTC domain-containing protein [Candidatus Peribacteria bacterium]|nr:VTC domain-containing protein [Candidatus Peribacteria bacterium]